MTVFLMFCHIAVFSAFLLLDHRRGVNRLRNLTLPIGIGFLYTAVIQASDSRYNLAQDLNERDLQPLLWVSLLSYLCVMVTHAMGRSLAGRRILDDNNIHFKRIEHAALLLYVIGITGYLIVIYQTGGMLAYFGSAKQTGSFYQLSGYVYMMRFATFGGCALSLFSMAFRRLSSPYHRLLIVIMTIVLWDAVKTCDRGDTIRAGMLWLSWVYFASRGRGPRSRRSFWGIAAMIGILIFIGMCVLILPAFRDNGRNILMSNVTFGAALSKAVEGGGASRFSEKNGGEIDTAVRIIKRVNAGEFGNPGPIHIAHWIWNVVPRALLPDKHVIFANWAGKDWMEIRFRCCSYNGCASTGAGEAYGMMGWYGLLYWIMLGMLLCKLESAFRGSQSGFIMSALCYLPILQLVVQDFWAGAMNASVVVCPVLVLIKWAQRPAERCKVKRQMKKRLEDIDQRWYRATNLLRNNL